MEAQLEEEYEEKRRVMEEKANLERQLQEYGSRAPARDRGLCVCVCVCVLYAWVCVWWWWVRVYVSVFVYVFVCLYTQFLVYVCKVYV